MNVQFITTTRSTIASVPVVNGQLIYLNDENAAFYDMGNIRNPLTSIRKVAALPDIGYDGIIYYINTSRNNSVHVWNSTTSRFVELVGLATSSAAGTVKPDNTTITINSGVISCYYDSAAQNKLAGVADQATKTSFSRILDHGTKVGTIVINDERIDLYAPTPVTTNATTSNAGLMSASDKTKLEGIETGATKVAFVKTQTSGTKVGTLTINSTSTDLYAPTPITTSATTSSAGLMSAQDKAKLNTISENADSVSFSQTLTSGSQVGVLSINGVATTLYAPASASTVGLVSGVKGNAEAQFRVGDVNITPENIGIVNATTAVAGLMTASDKIKLNGIQQGAEINVQSDWSVEDSNNDAFIKNKPTIPVIPGVATTASNGLMSAQDKAKLNGIQESADAVSFTRSLTSGTKVGTLTINGTGTDLYAPSSPGAATTASNGLMSAADKIKLNGIQESADAVSFTQSQTSGTKVGTITINGSGTDLYAPTPITAAATTSSNGLMSAADKIKLNGIESGAQVNPGVATTSAAGLLSASDKIKLDSVQANAEVNVQSDWDVSDSTSDAFIKNKPSINNGTLSIYQNGVLRQLFSANTSNDVSANITVPTSTSELTNDSNFLSYTDIAEILSIGSTAVVFSSSKITTSSTIDVYCSDDATVSYSDISVAASACTVSFGKPFETSKTIKIRVT